MTRKAAICLRTDSRMITAEGEKLKDVFDEVGALSLQLTAQQSRARLLSGV